MTRRGPACRRNLWMLASTGSPARDVLRLVSRILASDGGPQPRDVLRPRTASGGGFGRWRSPPSEWLMDSRRTLSGCVVWWSKFGAGHHRAGQGFRCAIAGLPDVDRAGRIAARWRWCRRVPPPRMTPSALARPRSIPRTAGGRRRWGHRDADLCIRAGLKKHDIQVGPGPADGQTSATAGAISTREHGCSP